MNLLTTHNHKLVKGEKLGYLSGILHLAPADLSGHEVCPKRSPECSRLCLNTSGMGAFHIVQAARVRKTKLFFEDRHHFLALLDHDIDTLKRKAEREGLIPCCRLNGTSDIAWEVHARRLMEKHHDLQFYDYTKIPKRMDKSLPKNYHLTFSRSEDNEAVAIALLEAGHNVAVVFSGPLPRRWMGFRVVSGDDTDLRFLDPKGCVVGLTAKGKAIKGSTEGFVVT